MINAQDIKKRNLYPYGRKALFLYKFLHVKNLVKVTLSCVLN